ncbi:MAG TPA: murein biosynthesis integral membrane protein MurJ, partial [Spirochaetia bacterium]|nr:murein biosynthesis integral membrane protein MurJ [Spirochaetia bacterium]
NIPNNLRKLLAEGALSSAFIPVLSRASSDEASQNDGVPQNIVRNLLTFQYLVLIPLLVLSVIFAGPITRFILDFPEVERQELAADLFRWFIHYTLLISISAVIMGTLNSRGKFTVPAFTPIIFSVCVISSVLLLHRHLGLHAMAVGILAGGLAQILVQAPGFRRLGFDFRPSFDFSNPYFRQIIRQWLPVVAASSVFAINQQVSLYFASGLESGSSSALANAVIFWQLPQGIFGVSIMTVLFPRMSREAALDDRTALKRTLGFGIRGIIALLIPSAIMLALLGREVVAIAFQRGNFELADTLRTAEVIAAYCIGMASVSAFNFLQRFFYSYGDYRTPTITAVGVVILDVILSLWLKETSLRVTGLAVANSVAFTVGALALLARTRHVVGGVEIGAILVTLGKTVLAVTPAAALILVARSVLGDWWQSGSSLLGFAIIAGIGVLCVATVAGAFILLRVEVVSLLVRRSTGRATHE